MMIEICNPNIPNRKRNKQISNIDKDYIRKKRNRISAQKARDRKKSYMDVLEKEIETLRKENCMLLTSNKLLEKEVTSLKEKNVQDKLNEFSSNCNFSAEENYDHLVTGAIDLSNCLDMLCSPPTEENINIDAISENSDHIYSKPDNIYTNLNLPKLITQSDIDMWNKELFDDTAIIDTLYKDIFCANDVIT
ncbi:hypothetical protein A3Q56_07033 [Intoshia linei]|uniref:X-box-binding protein 1 n=1 Tax=Intoshia linei TaxID=1819745 RepID=A0A177ATU7_9BILA|nr:hypothetical protein A3Q56_07033 [Intoshia linei]